MLHCLIFDMMMVVVVVVMMMMMRRRRRMPFLIEGNSRYSMCSMDFKTMVLVLNSFLSAMTSKINFKTLKKPLSRLETHENLFWGDGHPDLTCFSKEKHSIEGAIFFPIHPMSTNENHLWFVGKLRNHPGVTQRLKHPSVRLWKGPDVKDRDHLDGDSRRGLKSKTYNYIYLCIYLYIITYSTIGLFIEAPAMTKIIVRQATRVATLQRCRPREGPIRQVSASGRKG